MPHFLQMISQRGMRQGRVQRGVAHSLPETGGHFDSIGGCSGFDLMQTWVEVWTWVWCIWVGELWFEANSVTNRPDWKFYLIGIFQNFFFWRCSIGINWLWSWDFVSKDCIFYFVQWCICSFALFGFWQSCELISRNSVLMTCQNSLSTIGSPL